MNKSLVSMLAAGGALLLAAGCSSTHDDIFYKRLTTVPSGLSMRNTFLKTWTIKSGNEFHKDFELYSSLSDAKSGANPWKFCNAEDVGVGFPRDCGPSGAKGGIWNSLTRGGQANIEYSIIPGVTEGPLGFLFLFLLCSLSLPLSIIYACLLY